MEIAVFGPRDFGDIKPYSNYAYVSSVLDSYEITKLLSGGGVGVEEMALRFAAAKELEYEVIPPNIKVFGAKVAFIKRNEELINRAKLVVSFWDGRDRFYTELFAQAAAAHKPLHVYHVE